MSLSQLVSRIHAKRMRRTLFLKVFFDICLPLSPVCYRGVH